MKLRRRATSPPPGCSFFLARRVHGCRAGDQFRSAFGDAGGLDASSCPGGRHAGVVRGTRPGPPGPGGSHPRRGALAVRRGGGLVARHLVLADHRHRRRAAGVSARLRRRGLAHRLGGGAGGRPGRARRRQRQDRHPCAGRPGRLRARRRRRRRPRSLAQRARPAARYRLAAAVAGRRGVRSLRRLHDGARRLLPRRRPQQAADRALADDRARWCSAPPWSAASSSSSAPPAWARRPASLHADRIASTHAGPVRLGRLDRPAAWSA